MAIQSIQGSNATSIVTVYAMSQSGGPIALDSAIVKDAQGNTLSVVDSTGMDVTTVETTLTTIQITLPDTVSINSGSTYSVQLVSVAGGNFPSQSLKAS